MKANSLDRKIKKNGINEKLFFHRYRLSNAEYHKITQAVSSSALKDFYYGKNPQASYQRYIAKTVPNKTSDAMTIGSATHKLILEPRSFKKEFCIWDGRKAGKAWIEFRDFHNDKEIITRTQYEDIQKMQEAVARNSEASSLLSGGEAEQSVLWRDEETGLLCRARADYQKVVNGSKIIIDLKTCKSAEPKQFAKDLINLNYPLQQSMYMDGFDGDAFAFVCVEKETNTVQVYTLDDVFYDCGNMIYKTALERWAECVRNNHWPTYRTGVSQLDCPEWWANKVLYDEF